MNRVLFRALPMILSFGGVLGAQEEKFTLLLLPKPDQTVELRTVQDVDMAVAFEGTVPPELAAAGAMKLQGKTVMAFTQKTGKQDSQGGLEGEMTYTEANSQMSMNGIPMAAGNSLGQFVGKKITINFDSQGKVVDIKAPPEMESIVGALRYSITSMYNNLPAAPLSIGEMATVPISLQLPLPLAGAQPLAIGGQIRYKLIAVDREGPDRLARLSQSMEAQLTGEHTAGPQGKMKIDCKMTGTGNLQLNLDRAFLKTNEMHTTIEAKLSFGGDPAAPTVPTVNLRGTMKITTTGSVP
jgi:hypothetical protein